MPQLTKIEPGFLSDGQVFGGDINFTNSVGIGTNAPVTPLHISDGNSVDSSLYTSDYHTISAQGTSPGFNIISASSGTGHDGVFKATRSRGTLSSPVEPDTDDDVFSLLGAIYDGSSSAIATAAITMQVDGTVTSGNAPQRINFLTGTTTRYTRLTVKSNGNVGIGTTLPDTKLHVTAGSPEVIKVQRTSGANAGIQYTNDNGSMYVGLGSSANIFGISSANDIGANASFAVARTTGYVGVGTTNPSRQLHVVGSFGVSGNQYHGDVSQNTDNLRDSQTTVDRTPKIQVNGAAGPAASLGLISWHSATPGYYSPQIWLAKSNASDNAVGTNTIVSNGTDLGAINFAGNDGTTFFNAASIRAEIDGTPVATSSMPGRLVFFTTPVNGTVPQQRLQIDNAGNVAIGSHDPVAPLDISSTGDLLKFTTDRSWKFKQSGSGSTARLTLQSEVGNKSFCINNINDDINIGFYSTSTVNNSSITLGSDIPRTGLIGIDIQTIGTYAITSMPYSSNVNRQYLVVGTENYDGTTTDTWNSYGIQHRFKSNSSGIPRITVDGSGGEFFCIENGGNVGIGTNDPSCKLDVYNGTVEVAMGGVAENVTYGGRDIHAHIDIQSTSMRGGVLVRNMNDYRAITPSASFMHYDAYNSSATSYAFRASTGTTLSDTFSVKSNGDTYIGGTTTIGGRTSLGEAPLEWGNRVVKEYVTGYAKSYINDNSTIDIIKLGEFNFTSQSENIFVSGTLTSSAGTVWGTSDFYFSLRKSLAGDPPGVYGYQIITDDGFEPDVFLYTDSTDVDKIILAANAHDTTGNIHQIYWKIRLHERTDYDYYTNEYANVEITSTTNLTKISLPKKMYHHIDEVHTAIMNDVGIGTNSPRDALDIEAGDVSLSNNKYIGFNIYNDGTWKQRADGNAAVLKHHNVSGFQIYTGPSAGTGPDTTANVGPKLTIDDTGNVGIGTNDPQNKVHIQSGSVQFGTAVVGSFRTGSISRDTASAEFTPPTSGGIVAMTCWSDPGTYTYPQPDGTGLIYIDTGTSPFAQTMALPTSHNLTFTTTAYTGNPLDYTDNKITIIIRPNSIRIVHRDDSMSNAEFQFTFL